MPARLLDGRPLAEAILRDVRGEIDKISANRRAPVLALLRPNHQAALAYARSIDRTLVPIGVEVREIVLEETIDEIGFRQIVTQLNADSSVTGILALQPIPERLPRVLPALTIAPEKDVDGVTPLSAGRLFLGLPAIAPSTPAGAMELLRYYGVPVRGRRVVIIGRSPVVGRPLLSLLLAADATITVCHRQTADLPAVSRTAELLFVATGVPGLVTPDFIKPGTVVVDFGINVSDGRIVGDVHPQVAEVASALTPVPGGTGPVTNAVLARNLVTLAKQQRG
jgi:methylenetetrahydrofolate dehydrogenase (NADP+)/methenyltetrahydrofolate cyclohydrolase